MLCFPVACSKRTKNRRFSGCLHSVRMLYPSLLTPFTHIGMPLTTAKYSPTKIIIMKNDKPTMPGWRQRNKTTDNTISRRFISTPPALYQNHGASSGFWSSGKSSRHCPPVPAKWNRLKRNPSVVFTKVMLKMRKDRNRYPVSSPMMRCPASCKMR